MSYLSNFNYQLYGSPESPKLVFLHGLMGAGVNWRTIIKAFETDFHILSFDQRGHGRSFKPETGYDSKDYAGDLLKILDELGWNKITLIGHSMGGRNALSFAEHYSSRLNKLVIEDIGPEIRPDSANKMKRLLGMVPTPFSSRKEAKEYLMGPFKEGLMAANHVNPTMLAQYFYMNMKEHDKGVIDWRFYKEGILESTRLGRGQSAWPVVEALNVPTLVIRGENSDELSDEVLQKMAQMNSNIQCVTIADAAHWVHSDKPAEFIAELKSFI